MTMKGTRGLTKRYNLRPRPPDAAIDAEHLQTTPPVAAVANENQHDSADDAAETDSVNVSYGDDSASTTEASIEASTEASVKALHKQLPAQYDTNNHLQVAGMTTPTASTATNCEHDEGRRNSTEENIARDSLRERHIFRFADLPAELRIQIYKLSLATDERVYLIATLKKGRNVVYHERWFMPKLGLNLNLLLINKATYAEGGPILYANDLQAMNPKALFVFLGSLSATPKAWIENLTLMRWEEVCDWEFARHYHRVDDADEQSAYLLPALTALIGTTNLKHFHLHIRVDDYDSWELDPFVVQMYMKAHIWLEELVRQKGSKEDAVALIDITVVPAPTLLQLPDWSLCTDMNSYRTSMLREQLARFLC